MNTGQILLVLAPIIAIEFALIVLGLRDLTRNERRVRGDNKVVWALVIILISWIGPALYFAIGREEA
ncbi:MAG TPA: PLDc N-terminal domain-containing protein [Candidatus Limnocylindrales bacterium]